MLSEVAGTPEAVTASIPGSSYVTTLYLPKVGRYTAVNFGITQC